MQKRNFYLILVLILSVVIYHIWFTFGVFQNSDWWFFFSAKLKELTFYSTWTADIKFGSASLTLWHYPILLLYSVFGHLGFNSNIADFFVIFLPTIIVLPTSGFLLAKKVTKSNIGAFIGAIVFSFNTYLLTIETQGHNMIVVAFAWSGLATLFFLSAIEKQSKKDYILTAVMLSLSTFYDFRICYITIFALFFYTLYYSYFIAPKNKKFFYLSIKNITTLTKNLRKLLYPYTNCILIYAS